MASFKANFIIDGVDISIDAKEEIYLLLNEDDEFTLAYLDKALKENKFSQFGVTATNINEVVISRCNVETEGHFNSHCNSMSETNDIEQEDNNSSLLNTNMSLDSVWTNDATKLLLSLYHEYYPKVGKTIKLKNKKAIWKTICDKMCDNGYNFTVAQIENRYKTLDRGFKEKTIHNKKTGRNRASCLFEKQLTEINLHRKAVFPEFLLGATGNGKNGSTLKRQAGIKDIGHIEQVVVSATPSTSSPIQTSLYSPCTPKRAKTRTIIEEIATLREQREVEINGKYDLNSEKLALKKKALELEESKLEAYRERTEAIKHKNSLLEQLLRIRINKTK